MFACFCVLPIVAAFFASKQYVTQAYVVYLLFYFIPLIIVAFYEGQKHDFTDSIFKILKSPMTYVELAAEICLANVVVSDIMYMCLT